MRLSLYRDRVLSITSYHALRIGKGKQQTRAVVRERRGRGVLHHIDSRTTCTTATLSLPLLNVIPAVRYWT